MEKEICSHGFTARPKKTGCEACQKEHQLIERDGWKEEWERKWLTWLCNEIGAMNAKDIESFIERTLDNQKQSLLNKARKWQSENDSCMDCNGVNELIRFLDKND